MNATTPLENPGNEPPPPQASFLEFKKEGCVDAENQQRVANE